MLSLLCISIFYYYFLFISSFLPPPPLSSCLFTLICFRIFPLLPPFSRSLLSMYLRLYCLVHYFPSLSLPLFHLLSLFSLFIIFFIHIFSSFPSLSFPLICLLSLFFSLFIHFLHFRLRRFLYPFPFFFSLFIISFLRSSPSHFFYSFTYLLLSFPFLLSLTHSPSLSSLFTSFIHFLSPSFLLEPLFPFFSVCRTLVSLLYYLLYPFFLSLLPMTLYHFFFSPSFL